MICPTIHLNGSAGQVLMDDIFAAIAAIDMAQSTLRTCGPNGRDYPNGGIEVAVAQHRGRLQRLIDVANELEDMATNIAEQCDKRRR